MNPRALAVRVQTAPELAAYALKAVHAAAAFGVTLILARAGGLAVVGTYALVVSTGFVLGLVATAGLDQPLVRKVAGDLRIGAQGEARSAIVRSLTAVGLTGLVLAGGLALLAAVRPAHVLSALSAPVLLATAVSVPLMALNRMAVAAIRGAGRQVLGQGLEGLHSSILFVLLLTITAARETVSKPVVAGLLLVALAISAGLSLGVVARLVRMWPTATTFRLGSLRKQGVFVLAASLAIAFGEWLLLSLVAHQWSLEAAGTLRMALQITMIPATVVSTGENYSAPLLAGDFRVAGWAQLRTRYDRTRRLMLLGAGPVLLVAILAPEWLLGILFGSEARAAAPALVILALGQVVNVVSGPVGGLMIMVGRERSQLLVTLGGLFLLIALAVALVPGLGVAGAAIASAAALVFRNLTSLALAQAYLRRPETEPASRTSPGSIDPSSPGRAPRLGDGADSAPNSGERGYRTGRPARLPPTGGLQLFTVVGLPLSQKGPSYSAVMMAQAVHHPDLPTTLFTPANCWLGPPIEVPVVSGGPGLGVTAERILRSVMLAELRERATRRLMAAIARAPERTITWLFGDLGPTIARDIRSAGALVVREKTNCARAYHRRVLAAEHERLGLPPFDGVTEEAVAQEEAELAQADAIFCPSPGVLQSLLEIGIPREKLVESCRGWEPARLAGTRRLLPPAPGLTLVFCGTLNVRKGVPILLEAWARAGIEGRLVLAGDTDPLVARHFGHLLDRPDVIRLGFVDDVGALFRSADWFVFPTLEEGMPKVTYEAAACGVPGLVSPMGAGAFVRDGIEGMVIDSVSADVWAEAIARLPGLAEARQAMSEAGRRRAQEFTWEAVGQRLRAALLAVASRRA
ncbi:MAG: glycosyltransferase [Sphingomonadaceae bacterium]|uniref:glycosyltransferase n=1 Tax=Thermaurantiacus sp. TaxID=2820283 RepID=UPI00298F236B|nr:glycosyltransferase [Thermaurantiacus sp.]MCS6987040.1 glycosyltransferase [Sphingomonadaceae bacterium]MDW8415622.1 glycosyltransferase [Thermaurantiacus sp.]